MKRRNGWKMRHVHRIQAQMAVFVCLVLMDMILFGMVFSVALGGGMASDGVSGNEGTGNRVSSGRSVWTKVSADGGTEAYRAVALTFDDGPNRMYTETLLDGLKERDVKASFFLVGACIDGNESIVERMASDGHLIGVHCMQHTDLTKESEADAIRQLKETGEMIMAVTGTWPEYVRPPYGSWNERLGDAVREELHLTPTFWDVDSLDWKLQNTGKIVKKVVKDVENGDIILLHDEFGTSVEATFQIIDNLMAKGYTFVTIDELMVD